MTHTHIYIYIYFQTVIFCIRFCIVNFLHKILTNNFSIKPWSSKNDKIKWRFISPANHLLFCKIVFGEPLNLSYFIKNQERFKKFLNNW